MAQEADNLLDKPESEHSDPLAVIHGKSGLRFSWIGTHKT